VKVYTLYFDGSCGPQNPGGIAAYGFRLVCEGEQVLEGSDLIGMGPGMSNNVAEFTALYKGLCAYRHILAPGDHVNVRGDSLMVIKIMCGRWKAHHDKLYFNSYLAADRITRYIRRQGVFLGFDWIPREDNDYCDRLSKAPADKLS
jgi:ribonuclease HI